MTMFWVAGERAKRGVCTQGFSRGGAIDNVSNVGMCMRLAFGW
jgi:hypothetical protein